jgi:hypothetical protein
MRHSRQLVGGVKGERTDKCPTTRKRCWIWTLDCSWIILKAFLDLFFFFQTVLGLFHKSFLLLYQMFGRKRRGMAAWKQNELVLLNKRLERHAPCRGHLKSLNVFRI